MPATNPPSDPAAQLQWIVDREAIRNLIHDFGRSVDDKDHASYTANFVEDGTLELPFGTIRGRAAIAGMPQPLPEWSAQHHFGSILIDLDGDRARTRAYLQATHVFSADVKDNARAGGWYEHEVVRTPEGWRFASVKLVVIWEGERGMVPDAAAFAGEHAGH